ncbi:MAG: alpha/beta hydrolase [Candidatus Kapaibacterium sp.]|nr:MAG: alpha/beta hydrolase [Candidatus Kapabacteria bacterium]
MTLTLQTFHSTRFGTEYYECGRDHRARGARTIVLLHGLFENCTVWNGAQTGVSGSMSMVEILAREFHLVACNLIGHTASQPLPMPSSTSNEAAPSVEPSVKPSVEPSVSLQMMAEEVVALLENVQIEKAVFVGHSMGGAVAMQILRHFPEKVQGLCLFQATPFADSPSVKEARNTTIARIRNGEAREIAAALLEKILPESSQQGREHETAFLRAMLAECPPSGMIAGHEAMRDRQDTQEILNNADCPALIVLGKNDAIISIDAMLPLLKRSAATQWCVLENVAHAGMLEAPRECAAQIQAFMHLCG